MVASTTPQTIDKGMLIINLEADHALGEPNVPDDTGEFLLWAIANELPPGLIRFHKAQMRGEIASQHSELLVSLMKENYVDIASQMEESKMEPQTKEVIKFIDPLEKVVGLLHRKNTRVAVLAGDLGALQLMRKQKKNKDLAKMDKKIKGELGELLNMKLQSLNDEEVKKALTRNASYCFLLSFLKVIFQFRDYFESSLGMMKLGAVLLEKIRQMKGYFLSELQRMKLPLNDTKGTRLLQFLWDGPRIATEDEVALLRDCGLFEFEVELFGLFSEALRLLVGLLGPEKALVMESCLHVTAMLGGPIDDTALVQAHTWCIFANMETFKNSLTGKGEREDTFGLVLSTQFNQVVLGIGQMKLCLVSIFKRMQDFIEHTPTRETLVLARQASPNLLAEVHTPNLNELVSRSYKYTAEVVRAQHDRLLKRGNGKLVWAQITLKYLTGLWNESVVLLSSDQDQECGISLLKVLQHEISAAFFIVLRELKLSLDVLNVNCATSMILRSRIQEMERRHSDFNEMTTIARPLFFRLADSGFRFATKFDVLLDFSSTLLELDFSVKGQMRAHGVNAITQASPLLGLLWTREGQGILKGVGVKLAKQAVSKIAVTIVDFVQDGNSVKVSRNGKMGSQEKRGKRSKKHKKSQKAKSLKDHNGTVEMAVSHLEEMIEELTKQTLARIKKSVSKSNRREDRKEESKSSDKKDVTQSSVAGEKKLLFVSHPSLSDLRALLHEKESAERKFQDEIEQANSQALDQRKKRRSMVHVHSPHIVENDLNPKIADEGKWTLRDQCKQGWLKGAKVSLRLSSGFQLEIAESVLNSLCKIYKLNDQSELVLWEDILEVIKALPESQQKGVGGSVNRFEWLIPEEALGDDNKSPRKSGDTVVTGQNNNNNNNNNNDNAEEGQGGKKLVRQLSRRRSMNLHCPHNFKESFPLLVRHFKAKLLETMGVSDDTEVVVDP